jgi:hypothetical protein
VDVSHPPPPSDPDPYAGVTTDPRGEDPPDPGLTEADTADVIVDDAPDPTPAQVLPGDPEWIDPDLDAVPVDPDRLQHDAPGEGVP